MTLDFNPLKYMTLTQMFMHIGIKVITKLTHGLFTPKNQAFCLVLDKL